MYASDLDSILAHRIKQQPPMVVQPTPTGMPFQVEPMGDGGFSQGMNDFGNALGERIHKMRGADVKPWGTQTPNSPWPKIQTQSSTGGQGGGLMGGVKKLFGLRHGGNLSEALKRYGVAMVGEDGPELAVDTDEGTEIVPSWRRPMDERLPDGTSAINAGLDDYTKRIVAPQGSPASRGEFGSSDFSQVFRNRLQQNQGNMAVSPNQPPPSTETSGPYVPPDNEPAPTLTATNPYSRFANLNTSQTPRFDDTQLDSLPPQARQAQSVVNNPNTVEGLAARINYELAYPAKAPDHRSRWKKVGDIALNAAASMSGGDPNQSGWERVGRAIGGAGAQTVNRDTLYKAKQQNRLGELVSRYEGQSALRDEGLKRRLLESQIVGNQALAEQRRRPKDAKYQKDGRGRLWLPDAEDPTKMRQVTDESGKVLDAKFERPLTIPYLMPNGVDYGTAKYDEKTDSYIPVEVDGKPVVAKQAQPVATEGPNKGMTPAQVALAKFRETALYAQLKQHEKDRASRESEGAKNRAERKAGRLAGMRFKLTALALQAEKENKTLDELVKEVTGNGGEVYDDENK